jgi:acid phosphatase type 7
VTLPSVGLGRRHKLVPGRRQAVVTVLVLLIVTSAGLVGCQGAGSSPGPSSGGPVIVAAGDIACGPTDHPQPDGGTSGEVSVCGQMATSNLVLKIHPAAVLELGDNQYPVGRYQSYERYFGASWGRFDAISHPVPGNHEYLSRDANGYYRYFGAAAGDPGRGYYSYDLGNWHLIALNAECGFIGGCASGSAEERWLAADLHQHPTACILAYWHQPRFSSGQHGDEPVYDAFWRDLFAAHADVVLNGHDHDYERFAPQDPFGHADPSGIREFVVGTGGKSHYRFKTIQPNSVVRNDTASGVLVMTLHPDSYSWRFESVAGSFQDSGTARCHGAGGQQ